MISLRLPSNPCSTSNGGFQEVISSLLVRTGSSMHLTLRTFFASQRSDRPVADSVLAAAGGGALDVAVGPATKGSVECSSAPARATELAAVSSAVSGADRMFHIWRPTRAW